MSESSPAPVRQIAQDLLGSIPDAYLPEVCAQLAWMKNFISLHHPAPVSFDRKEKKR